MGVFLRSRNCLDIPLQTKHFGGTLSLLQVCISGTFETSNHKTLLKKSIQMQLKKKKRKKRKTWMQLVGQRETSRTLDHHPIIYIDGIIIIQNGQALPRQGTFQPVEPTCSLSPSHSLPSSELEHQPKCDSYLSSIGHPIDHATFGTHLILSNGYDLDNFE